MGRMSEQIEVDGCDLSRVPLPLLLRRWEQRRKHEAAKKRLRKWKWIRFKRSIW